MTRSICLALTATAATYAADLPDEVFSSIRSNDLAAIRRYAADPASRDIRGRQGFTPLMHAAAFGSVDAMRILIDAKADVNAKNAHDATALIYGAWDAARIRLLLDNGADPTVRTKQGQTVLLIASSVPGNAEGVRLLMARGAPIDSRALIHVARWDFDLTKALVEKGADVNVTDGRQGFTALLSAAGSGQLDIVRLLIAKGAKIDQGNVSFGTVRHGDVALKELTPLMLAAPYGTPEMIQTLLAAGADPKRRDVRGMTPLMLAVASENQDPRVVELLLVKGSDVNAQSGAGESALDWARKFGNPKVIALLEKHGAKAASTHREASGEPAPAADSRAALVRSAGLIQKSATEFFRQSGCPACHNVSVSGMMLAPLRNAGVPLDEKAIDEMRVSIPKSIAPAAPILLQRMDIGGTADSALAMLNGMAGYGYSADATVDTFVNYLAGFQMPDGRWSVNGGISRAPMEDADIGRTAFAIRAFKAYGWPARQAEFDERNARAQRWLAQAKPAFPYERAEQMLGLKWAGASPDTTARMAKALLTDQRPDGGWAQTRYLASDAYATGIALWALHESGHVRATDAAYRKGVEFLRRTQRADGSWYVRSRSPKFQPYFEGGFPYHHDQWISNQATAIATIALAPAAGTAVASVR